MNPTPLNTEEERTKGIREITDFVFLNSNMKVGQRLIELREMIETYTAKKVVEARIKELEMLPVMRQGLHTPQKELDIILVDTVNQRISKLQALQQDTSKGEVEL